jgi:photosystem II stability/assembly factor-like uncharacterized protein
MRPAARAGAVILVLVLGGLGAPALTQDPDTPTRSPERAAPVVTSLTLFAGARDGLWRSADWGGSWSRVVAEPGAGAAPLESLGAARALLPLGPQVWLGGEGGLYLSDDFGVTWKRLFPGAEVNALMTSRYPQADPTVFLGTPRGLLRSVDGGATFRPTLITSPVTRIEWPGPALVAATSQGVAISEDGADSFRGRGEGLPESAVEAMAVSSFFGVDPVLFAGGAFGVYRSSDAGRTWKPTRHRAGAVSDLQWLGPFLYAAGEGGVQRSDDVGDTWVPLSEGLDRRSVRRLMFPLAPAAGLEAFVATDDGVFRTLDGGQKWQRAGLDGKAVYVLATFPPPAPATGKRRK